MGEPGPRRAGLERRWSGLHHGVDPARVPLLGRWLSAMWTLARPLAAARVPPTAITVAGAVLAVDAVLLAAGTPWAAALAVLAAALCDGLDGAVAVVGDRATRSGAWADATADRVADVAFALVVWRCGAPLWAALVAAALAVGVDTLRRARRVRATITVAERPSWTVCAVLACVVAGTAWAAEVCAGVWIGLGLVGVVQVSRARRPRRAPSGAP